MKSRGTVTLVRKLVEATPEEITRAFAPDWGLELWEIRKNPNNTYTFVFGRETRDG